MFTIIYNNRRSFTIIAAWRTICSAPDYTFSSSTISLWRHALHRISSSRPKSSPTTHTSSSGDKKLGSSSDAAFDAALESAKRALGGLTPGKPCGDFGLEAIVAGGAEKEGKGGKRGTSRAKATRARKKGRREETLEKLLDITT